MNTQPSTNGPYIFNFSTIDLSDLIEAQSRISYRPTPFDPTSIAALLDEQWAAWPALAEALRRCTTQWSVEEHFAYLVDPASPEAELPHKATLLVHCPERGEIRLNILVNGTIAELTFTDYYQRMAHTSQPENPPNEEPPFTALLRVWERDSESS